MHLIAGSLLVLIACGGGSESPSPQPSPATPTLACQKTIADASMRIAAESAHVGLTSAAERGRLTMTASCEAEKWSAEVMTCIGAARLDVDLAACLELLPHVSYKRLQNKIALLAPPAPPTPVPTIAVTPPRPAVAPRRPINVTPRVRRNDDLLGFDPEPPKSCASSIANPRDPACIKQYCRLNPFDARCMIE